MSVFEDGWEPYGSPLLLAGSIMARRCYAWEHYGSAFSVVSFDAWEHGSLAISIACVGAWELCCSATFRASGAQVYVRFCRSECSFCYVCVFAKLIGVQRMKGAG